MSFPINTNIPAAGNNPSVDQPEMLKNFQNINSFVSVDHAAPTNGQAGQHNQVRFAINQGAPALNSAVLELFCNSTSGVSGTESTLFFQNAARILRLTNLNFLFSGTDFGVVTPWGLIFNFGLAVAAGTTATITYVQPMTTLYSIQVTGVTNGANLVTASVTGNNLTATVKVSLAASSVYYFVVGK